LLCTHCGEAIGWAGAAWVVGVRATLFGCQHTQKSHPWRSPCPDNRTAPREQTQIFTRPDYTDRPERGRDLRQLTDRTTS
jgi:hypothetical protein